MKKLFLMLILGLLLLPSPAAAQKWVDPFIQKDGTYVGGHWEEPKDSWQRSFQQPGTMNPFTGQWNTYGPKNYPAPPGPPPAVQNLLSVPGSSTPNPYAIPGSNAPNPYAIPGSGPKGKVQIIDKATNPEVDGLTR
jgi:hypothetical protein